MNNEVCVKFVRLNEHAILPKFNIIDPLTGDAGADVYSVEECTILPQNSQIVNIGLQLGYITPGYWFRIYPRSGIGFKYGIQPHLGTIDPQYRGNMGIKLYNFSTTQFHIKSGDRIAQLVFYKLIQPNIMWVDKIEETLRNANGFGSTGR